MKSSEYMREVKKADALADLRRVQSRIDTMIGMYERRKSMDVKSKRRVIEIYEFVMPIFDTELSRELVKQKKSGKEFISDKEIDLLVKKAKSEHGGCKKN